MTVNVKRDLYDMITRKSLLIADSLSLDITAKELEALEREIAARYIRRLIVDDYMRSNEEERTITEGSNDG